MGIEINYVNGFAGTGKSTHLIKYVKSLLEKGIQSGEIICLFPTHKAKDRVKCKLPDTIGCETLHSILSWIPSINEDAKIIDHIDTTKRGKPKNLEGYKYVILDEGGMVSEDMLTSLISVIETLTNFGELYSVYVSVYLDTFQNLPVKGRQISIDYDNCEELTTQYRVESRDISDTFTKFVNYIKGTNTTDLVVSYSENILPFDLDKFQKGDRLLAYTNECVGHYNRLIAKKFDINSYIGQEVQLGNMTDTLICEEFITPDLEELVSIYDSESLVMQNTKINPNYVMSSLKAMIDLKDKISFIRSGDFVFPVVKGIYEHSIYSKELRHDCLKDKKNFKHLYAFNRAFVMDYTFASTVHKAQGQEFETVFIIKDDIQKSIFENSYRNYSRLMYVALSRAIKKVYI